MRLFFSKTCKKVLPTQTVILKYEYDFFFHSLLYSVPSLLSLEETKLYIGVDYGKPQLSKFLVKLLMKPVVSCCWDECTVKGGVKHLVSVNLMSIL